MDLRRSIGYGGATAETMKAVAARLLAAVSALDRREQQLLAAAVASVVLVATCAAASAGGDASTTEPESAAEVADVEPQQLAMWRAQARKMAMNKPAKTSANASTAGLDPQALGVAPGAGLGSSPRPAAPTIALGSPPLAAASPAGLPLAASPATEEAAAREELIGAVPDSVRTVDLFDENEQEYQHGTPAPQVQNTAAESPAATLSGLSLPAYVAAPPADLSALLNVSNSTLNDSSFTAGAKNSFLAGIYTDSEGEEEEEEEEEPAEEDAQDAPSAAWQADAEADDISLTNTSAAPVTVANPAYSPALSDKSFDWPSSNGWGTPQAPSPQVRPHAGGGTPKPLGASTSEPSVKQILRERGAAIDAAVEASVSPGKFLTVQDVLAGASSSSDFKKVLAAVQEQQKRQEADLDRRRKVIAGVQAARMKERANATTGDFQSQLSSLLGEARSTAAKKNAAPSKSIAGVAFRDMEFSDEEDDGGEYRPSPQELLAARRDAAEDAGKLAGAVAEPPPRRAPAVTKRPNKKKARGKQAKQQQAACTKENRMTVTTAGGHVLQTAAPDGKAAGAKRQGGQRRALKATPKNAVA